MTEAEERQLHLQTVDRDAMPAPRAMEIPFDFVGRSFSVNGYMVAVVDEAKRIMILIRSSPLNLEKDIARYDFIRANGFYCCKFLDEVRITNEPS